MSSNGTSRQRAPPQPLPVVDLGRLLGMPRPPADSTREERQAALREFVARQWEEYHAHEAAPPADVERELPSGPRDSDDQQAADDLNVAVRGDESRESPTFEDYPSEETNEKRHSKEIVPKRM